MPVEYKIDKSLGMVFSFAYGTVVDHEAFLHQSKLKEDSNFDPSFSQFMDFSKVTSMKDLTTEGINHLAERNPFGLGSKRAFYAPSDLTYGVSRMFQILTNDHSDELCVFRDIHEARKYLSLE